MAYRRSFYGRIPSEGDDVGAADAEAGEHIPVGDAIVLLEDRLACVQVCGPPTGGLVGLLAH
jgi:hypothetical protein